MTKIKTKGISLTPRELTKLANLWGFHSKNCKHLGDVRIAHFSGGGIGTTTIVFCGCGEEIDATDYFSW